MMGLNGSMVNNNSNRPSTTNLTQDVNTVSLNSR